MRRYWYLAIAGAIAAAIAMVPLAAFAASAVLTAGSAGGPAASGTLTGTNSGNVTFVNTANSNQFATCSTSSITATIVTNPMVQGVATETVSNQSFSGCSLTGVNFGGIKSITANANTTNCPWNASVDDTGTPPPANAAVTIRPNGGTGCSAIVATVVATVFGIAQNPCNYSPHSTAGTLTGTAPIGGSSITFSNQQFDKTSGPNVCFASAFFNGTYTFKDSNGNAVFTN